jgi:rSAM/selenodomain-associated transferase 2
VAGQPTPFLSIIVPVFYEADTINLFLAKLRLIKEFDSCEVIIVDGSTSQETIECISGSSVVKVASHRAGRGFQMNIGASRARGDMLLFLHADTILPANAISLIRQAMKDERLVAGSFRLAIDSTNPALRVIARLTTMRSRFTRLPFGDQGIFIRKSVFEKMNGFRDIPLMEDLDLMLRIRSAGLPIVILPASVLTSSRRWDRDGIVLGTLRNWILRALFYLGVSPVLFAKWYS